MVKLEFLTDDEHLIALAKAYWAMDDAGEWLHKKVSALEELFDVPRGRAHGYVSRACVAMSLTPYCSECGAPAIFSSRTEAETFRRQLQRPRALQSGWARVCTDCRADARAKQQEALEAEVRARHSLVSDWLQQAEQSQAAIDYCDMELHDAFLLEGLLRYAGNAWRGHALDGWERHQTQLCGDADACRSVYEKLYRAGWLSPSPDSPLDAFAVEGEAVVGFDILRVNWTLAADLGGEPFEAVLDAAASTLRRAGAAEVMPLWQWVCLRELRSHFNYCHEHFNFRSRGWTPTIESNLVHLLDECSLGVAKTVMWKCFKHLAAELQKRTRPAQHTYNMLPGSFQRTYDHWRARGWMLDPWRRPAVSNEYVLTSLLFDRVLGGGTDFYNRLTGLGLINGTPPDAEPGPRA